MGVSSSPLAFARKCVVASEAMERVAKSSVETTALATKRAILDISPSRLRGVGKSGANLGVRYKLSESPVGPTALVFATGPWQFIEGDTKAHPIPRFTGSRASKKTGLTKFYGPAFGQNKGSVVAFGGNVFSRVWHPGTKGKHLFAKGAVAGVGLAGQITKRETSAAIRSIF